MLRKSIPSKLKIIPLAATLFFVVSGGPNGLEDLVRQSGPGVCLLLLVLTPLIWSLPCALMTAELTSAIPAEGGYYVWVHRALGPFWGFTCALWSWIYSLFDVAVYPVLVVGILKEAGLVPWESQLPFGDLLLVFGVTLPFVALNIFGIRPVGRGSLILGFCVLAPFLCLALLGLAHPSPLGHLPFSNSEHGFWGSLGVGLSVCMWNYLGWDNLSTVAAEIEEPQRTYPRAIALTLPLIVFLYILVVVASLAVFPDWKGYESGIWVQIAQKAGGWPLFVAVTVAGIASSLGQFNGMLLGVSRIPLVLGQDGYLPKAFAWLHPRFGTPILAILVCAAFTLLFSMKSFTEIIELDVLFYSAGIVLEFIALLVLRRREPHLARPYRIPGGTLGLILISVPPLLLILVTFVLSVAKLEPFKLTFFGIAILAPPILYLLRQRIVNLTKAS